MEEIFIRRSIRKFEDKEIEKEKIDRILRAAMQAPSAANQQPWEFIVVTDKEDLNVLSQASPYSKPVEGSGATIILLGDSRNFRVPDCWHQDMGAAAQNILLEAVHLELGGVWMALSANQGASEYVIKHYDLPEYIKPFAFIALGYPADQKNQFVDRYQESRVHYGKW